ncbi:MAG: aminodeoxychorismate/anthranilate synthase component II [Nitrososphaerota archaeon]|jgi:anthranilate synthase component 2|nr:aminodeoxychorismate/anthranilate synthase component II [Nitrososphaerota archaeon]
MKVLLIDNYDSFVYNLAQYVGEQGGNPEVFRNDAISVESIKSNLKPDAIIISPGPGNPSNPKDFGVCGEVLKILSPKVPTLGVCFGHQGIGYVYGAKIGRAKNLRHGKTSLIEHDGKNLFKGLPTPIEGTRYHSLVIRKNTVPAALKVTAVSMDDHEIMGIQHNDFPIFGVQFHPESIKTTTGSSIIKNFLDMV